MERKKKFGSYIYKESAPLTKKEFYKILDGDYKFLLSSPYSLCREFYVECVSNLMRPRTIVDYDRVPWIMDEGTVRITFDSDVRAAVGSYDIFDPSLPTLPVLEAGKLVMEVKFTEMLPQIVRDLLPPNAQEFTAVSKYVLCYEKSQYLHGFEYWNETQEKTIMSIQDMIKKSVLESGVFDSFNAPKMAISLIVALLLGAVIYMVYSKFYVGVIFSRSFAVTLVGMTLLTCMVTLAISTNIVISLGMVGALSIVRFRTAVKDPMDLLYLSGRSLQESQPEQECMCWL